MNVINFHLTNNCNYHCIYCFGKFPDKQELSLKTAYLVVDNIYRYFKKRGITDGRINLAGGEPLLYTYLDELIAYINAYGIKVSIITNGSLLTEERIKSWKDKVYCIGLSIDSTLQETNMQIGRCCSGKVLSVKQAVRISQAVHRNGILLKVNTVVSKLNVNEDMTELYKRLKPDRLKLIQVEIIEETNGKALKYKISKKEFDGFCKKHKKRCRDTRCEYSDDMENSYLMINPAGEVQLNDAGEYKTYGNCIEKKLDDILKITPLNLEKFNSRYNKERKQENCSKKICVFGGHDTWLKEIFKQLDKNKSDNINFFKDGNLKSLDVIRNADEIWFQSNAISHSFYGKVLAVARANNVPVFYFDYAGVKKCAEQFLLKRFS